MWTLRGADRDIKVCRQVYDLAQARKQQEIYRVLFLCTCTFLIPCFLCFPPFLEIYSTLRTSYGLVPARRPAAAAAHVSSVWFAGGRKADCRAGTGNNGAEAVCRGAPIASRVERVS